MKDSIGDRARLIHISEAAASAQQFLSNVTKEQFLENYLLQLAITKLLENVGEASAKITQELQLEFPHVEWKLIIRSRNIYVHQYFALDLEAIWSAAVYDLPPLKEQVDNILSMKFHYP